MVYIVTYELQCDGRDCRGVRTRPCGARDRAAEIAMEDGWLIEGRKHYCPECAKRRQPKARAAK